MEVTNNSAPSFIQAGRCDCEGEDPLPRHAHWEVRGWDALVPDEIRCASVFALNNLLRCVWTTP